MFKRSMQNATQEQQRRQDHARELGCIACIIWNGRNKWWKRGYQQAGPSEIHHQTRSGRQIGQDETVCLCSWHHRAICLHGKTARQMASEFGPSLAGGSKTFFAEFGSNEEQLLFQNNMIAKDYGT